jgi:hypothetical protein
MKTEEHNVGSIAWCMMHNCFYSFRLHLSFILKVHVMGYRTIEMCMCCMQNFTDLINFLFIASRLIEYYQLRLKIIVHIYVSCLRLF